MSNSTQATDDSASDANRSFWRILRIFRRNNQEPEYDGYPYFWAVISITGLMILAGILLSVWYFDSGEWFANTQSTGEFVILYGAVVILIGVFPLTYLAYLGFRATAQRRKLKDDFRLLGLVSEAELDETVEKLYQTVYSNIQFIVYITLIMGFVMLMLAIRLDQVVPKSALNVPPLEEPDPASTETTNELPGETGPEVADGQAGAAARDRIYPLDLNAAQVKLMFYAFVGAYLFSVQELVRRYNTFDLRPQVYSSILSRMILAVGVVMVGTGMIVQDAGADSTQPIAPLALVVAFIIGAFPQTGITWLTAKAGLLLGITQNESDARPLSTIVGISPWHYARLFEMGIDDAQNLATADIRKLLLTTQFDTQQIIHWIDQAILYVKVGTKLERFREHHINSFHELQVTLMPMASGVRVESHHEGEEARHALLEQWTTQLGLANAESLARISDSINYPNYSHIAEFYTRTSLVVQQRAEAGTEALFGSDAFWFAGEVEIRQQQAESAQGGGLTAAKRAELQRILNQTSKLLMQQPNNSRLLVAQGVAYHGLGDRAQARFAFDSAIQADSENASAYLARAAYYLDPKADSVEDNGDKDTRLYSSIRDCTKSIALRPTDAIAYNYRGLANMELKFLDRARADLNKALVLDECLPVAYMNRGVLNNTMTYFKEADADFRAAYLLGTRTLTLWIGWGKTLIALTKYDESIDKLAQADRFDFEQATVYASRGYAYLQQGEAYYHQAEANLCRAIENDRQHWFAYNNLGLLKARQGNYEEATQYYMEALRLRDRSLLVRFNLAIAYYHLGNLVDSKNLFQELVTTAPPTRVEFQYADRYLKSLFEPSQQPLPEPARKETPENDLPPDAAGNVDPEKDRGHDAPPSERLTQEPSRSNTFLESIDTSGGVFVGGSIHTGGGDFVGRDVILLAQQSMVDAISWSKFTPWYKSQSAQSPPAD